MTPLSLQDGAPPGACDRFLVPPGGGDPCAGRAWLTAAIAHALPPDAEAALMVAGDAVLLPLLRQGRRLGNLTTPYSLVWRPLPAPGTGAAALAEAGRDLGRALRGRPPALLEALDAGDAPTAALIGGLRAAGLAALRFDHFGNWYETLPPETDWGGYLAARPAALRNTIRRRLARAAGRFAFSLLAAPGPALEAGIDAFAAVRAASWKPDEPFPEFDAALMRATAATGELRLGLLHAPDGAAVAAQYWLVSAGSAILPKLFHAEAARAESPGTVLTAMMIRHLLEVDQVRSLDFGRGDDSYKRGWVAARRQRIGVLVADPRYPAGLAAVLRHAVGRLRARLRPAAEPAE